MIKANTRVTLNNLKSGTSKNGQQYWISSITDYSIVDSKLAPQGFINLFVNGQPIANKGENVYIHEIQAVSVKKYRNKQGGWSTIFTITAKCGLQPLKG